MNRIEFFATYRQFLMDFGLRPQEAIVGAGGACLVYGLREVTEDIDLGVSDKLFDALSLQGFEHKPLRTNDFSIEIGKVSVHRWEDVPTQVVRGVGVYTPQALLQQKLWLNRPKDQADIVGLRKLLGETS